MVVHDGFRHHRIDAGYSHVRLRSKVVHLRPYSRRGERLNRQEIDTCITCFKLGRKTAMSATSSRTMIKAAAVLSVCAGAFASFTGGALAQGTEIVYSTFL